MRTLAGCLLCVLCSLAQAEELKLNIHWIMPDSDPLWEPWMGGEPLYFLVDVATENETIDDVRYQYIDAEGEVVVYDLDLTGLDDASPILFNVRIPDQYIIDPRGWFRIGTAFIWFEVTNVGDMPYEAHVWMGILDFEYL